MKFYEQYSISALKVELDNIKRLQQLVKEMEKPENFTYIDVLNLHTCLETLYNELQDVTKKKQSTI